MKTCLPAFIEVIKVNTYGNLFRVKVVSRIVSYRLFRIVTSLILHVLEANKAEWCTDEEPGSNLHESLHTGYKEFCFI